ncbi:MAG: hypothetical protein II951_05640 [Bacteroidales bacterium]|nr:hypothetical protein [Bacteroidales bacterium]
MNTKQISLSLCVAALTACAGGTSNQGQSQTEAPLVEQQTSSATAKTMKILLPHLYDKLPETIRNANSVEKLVATVSEDSEASMTWEADWSNEDCLTQASVQVLEKNDGTWLVLLIHEGGCGCTQQQGHYAGVFDGTTLKDVEWPIPQPEYTQLIDKMCEWGIEPSMIQEVKASWDKGASYLLTRDNRTGKYSCLAGEQLCDGAELTSRARSLRYEFDGETFKHVGMEEHCLIGPSEDSFGPVHLGGPLPENIKLEGYVVEPEVAYTYIKAANTDDAVVSFFSPMTENSVRRIEIYSSDYAKEVGELVSNVLESWSETTEIYCYKPDEYTCYIGRGYGRWLSVDPNDVECSGKPEKGGLFEDFEYSIVARVKAVVLTNEIEVNP